MKKVTIDSSEQDEEGVSVLVGSTMRITVWDSDNPDAESKMAKVIKKAIKAYLTEP